MLGSAAAIALVALPYHAEAQSPQSPTIAAGSVAVTRQGATTVVTQGTQKGIIDWRSFSIGPQEAVRFDQPGRSSVTLNRVTGTEASRIDGSLSATGQVWLANPNGVMIGTSGQVNVGGLMATTGRVDAQEFLATGRAKIDQIAKDASIVNGGSIMVGEGGYAALAAAAIRNEGVISARTGAVAFGAGKAMTVDFAGDRLITFQVTQPLGQAPAKADAAIINGGTIAAQGGTVQMSARAAKGVMDNVINLKGHVVANAVRVDGGTVLFGDGGAVTLGGKIDVGNAIAMVSNGDAGGVSVSGVQVTLSSAAEIDARGARTGGQVSLTADRLLLDGKIDASGKTGGTVAISGDVVTQSGTLAAKGASQGGTVTVAVKKNYQATQSATLDASASSGPGGAVRVIGTQDGSPNGPVSARVFHSGAMNATSDAGKGGAIDILAQDILLVAATADVSGGSGGGVIRVGGDWQGRGALAQARSVLINGSAILTSSARSKGDGGKVVIWSEDQTRFSGRIIALGAGSGVGGAVEVSSKGTLTYAGTTRAAQLLLDPKNIIIDNSVAEPPVASVRLTDPGTGAGATYGTEIRVLPNGNIVVTSPYDSVGGEYAGAAYLFNGTTGALISTLKGSTAGDLVSNDGVALLNNGNYVVRSSAWNNGGTAANAGAVTWGNGVTGIAGVVSASNSLVGTKANDFVGSGSITELSNGNYVVSSPVWNNGGTAANAGAVTWASGTGGTVGAVSTSNSLVGTTAFDRVGVTGVTPLSNGNFVVISSNWSKGGTATNAGAVTWVNGTTGLTATGSTGEISASNSLVGTVTNDKLGINGVTALTNGNYVVISALWTKDGSTALAKAQAGAVTWGNGATGIVGEISDANSLIGTTANDRIGLTGTSGTLGGVTALSNGNYVVSSRFWNNGGTAAQAGAVTWGNGTAGIVGAVTVDNSLVGTKLNDRVGINGVTALSNGNYVVISSFWRNVTLGSAGAVTFGNGTEGIKGAVTDTNSLVGTKGNDRVGLGGVTPLSNGNYVVSSPNWNNGGTAALAGAVTWGNGATGITGAVSASNSLVGTTASD